MLTEIRDIQRQHFEEYRRVAVEALTLQKQAIAHQTTAVQAQASHIRLYKLVMAITALVVFPLIAYLLWTLLRLV